MLLPVRTEFSGVKGEREKNIFPVQVTARRQRIGNQPYILPG